MQAFSIYVFKFSQFFHFIIPQNHLQKEFLKVVARSSFELILIDGLLNIL